MESCVTKKIIDDYVQEIDKCMNQKDAKILEEKIVSIFLNYIPNLKKGLDKYNPKNAFDFVMFEKKNQEDYLKDLQILKTKLELYKDGL